VERIDKLVAELTLEEKISLVHGRDMMATNAVPRLGIPHLYVTDGPHGARGRSFGGPSAAAFPCGTAMGATWDPDLIGEVGVALAGQVLSKGANILLGPTMNIHRSPLAGRNFECISEDPFLTSRTVVSYIRGLQSTGEVGGCAKHYIANDSEFERHTISSEVDERTLREIYLPPFEASVREADVWWVMTAYNRINGTYAAEHAELLQTILRDEWGFQGLVVSDWWGTQSTVPSATAGLDLEMPGPGVYFADNLLEAVRTGAVAESIVDEKVRRVLETMERAGRLDGPEETSETSLDLPADRALIRRVGAESCVLLRNEGDVLPLRDLGRVAVVGPLAQTASTGGGGSSAVVAHYETTPLDGIRAALGDGVEVVSAVGCLAYKLLPELQHRLASSDGEPGLRIDYFDNPDLEGAPVRTEVTTRFRQRWLNQNPVGDARFSARLSGTFTPDTSGVWTFSLVAASRARLAIDGHEVVDNWTDPQRGDAFFGLGSSEQTGTIELQAGSPHAITVEFRAAAPQVGMLLVGCLPPMASDPIGEAVEAARDADAAVVVVGTNAEWETEGNDRDSMDLPGDQVELIRAVAAVQPNTAVVVISGAPVTMDWTSDVPAVVQTWFGGQESGNAIADVLFGAVNPSGKLPTTIPARYEDNPAFANYPGSGGSVSYEEGVFVGYRHYDANGVEPAFPFGHGLSYTTFGYGDLVVERASLDEVVVSIDVTNTGDVAGKEVVQLYVSDVKASVPRPPQELKAFEKVALEPGATKTVRFTLDRRALSFWSDGWTAEPGEFELRCGSSSRDIRATVSFTV
jgi:beta-glucosidase